MPTYTGSIIGFCNLGDFNEHLIALEKQTRREDDNGSYTEKCPAKTMLVLFVKGLFSNLAFPHMQFACSDLSGELMYGPVWEAVARLELCGMALVCDGLAANRKLFRLHNPDLDIVYKTPNPYCDDGRELFLISDPPHLIKTVRNAWCNSKHHLWVCFVFGHCYFSTNNLVYASVHV